MATITQLPFYLSFSSFHYRKPLLYYRHHQQQQFFASYVNSTKNCGFVCFACSVGQTRVRKKVKSNEELRSEILEFVTLVGLPEGHVPSMKELSEHGRMDLANIVRRRGYKFIKGLLSNSDIENQKEVVSETEIDATSSATSIYLEDSITGQGEGAVDLDDGNLLEQLSSMEVYLTATDGSLSCDKENNNFPEESVVTSSSPESEEHEMVNNDDSSLAGISSMENCLSSSDDGMHLQVGEITYSGEITGDNLKIESVEINNTADINTSSSEVSVSANHDLVFDDSGYSDREADNVLMTEDEEANNVDGYVSLSDDALAYDHYTSPDLNYTSHGDIATESLSALTSEDTIATGENFQNQMDDMAEIRSGSADHSLLESGDNDRILGVSSSSSSIEEKTSRFIQSGYLDTVDDDDNDKATESCLEESKESPEAEGGDSYFSHRSMSTSSNGSALGLEEVTHATTVSSFDRNSQQSNRIADTNNDLHDETMKREIQVEITRLRFLLRQKEQELLKLKEQIEKEKLSFSVLQRQAETEINKAQMLISEKDVELQAAEENLSGLQEVEIDFCGDGSVVEVMGSFNGWQHRVEMELQPSKSTGDENLCSLCHRWFSEMLLNPVAKNRSLNCLFICRWFNNMFQRQDSGKRTSFGRCHRSPVTKLNKQHYPTLVDIACLLMETEMLVDITVVVPRHIRDKVHRGRSLDDRSSKRFGYKRTHHKQHSQSRQMLQLIERSRAYIVRFSPSANDFGTDSTCGRVPYVQNYSVR